MGGRERDCPETGIHDEGVAASLTQPERALRHFAVEWNFDGRFLCHRITATQLVNVYIIIIFAAYKCSCLPGIAQLSEVAMQFSPFAGRVS